MNFNEKLISLRKSKGAFPGGAGGGVEGLAPDHIEMGVVSVVPDFQRLVLLSDYFGLTLDELVKDVDVQQVRERNMSEEKVDSIYNDVKTAKSIFKWYLIIAGGAAGIALISMLYFIVNAVYGW